MDTCAAFLRRRQWQPTPALLPGKSHGWRSLVGCSPWGHEELTWRSDFTFTFHFHALEKEMATHSSVLAWRIPGTGDPGVLPFMGLHRVGHDWSNLAAAAALLTLFWNVFRIEQTKELPFHHLLVVIITLQNEDAFVILISFRRKWSCVTWWKSVPKCSVKFSVILNVQAHKMLALSNCMMFLWLWSARKNYFITK